MITFPHSNISVGSSTLRLGCQLTGLSGRYDYHIGDQLRGELILQSYQKVDIERIEARLEFVIQEDFKTSRQFITGSVISERLSLSPGSQQRVSFNLLKQFGRANNLKGKPASFWRMVITIFPAKPEESLIGNIRALGKAYQPTSTNFQVPVKKGRGQFRARPRTLKIQSVKGRELMILLVAIGFSIHFGMTMSEVLSFSGLRILMVAISLPLILLLLLRLIRFRDTPMQIVQNGDGKLRVQLLDRGDDSWQKMTIGYQVLSRHLKRTDNKTKVVTEALFKKEYQLADIANRKEHLIEATLPWPEWPHRDLPLSYVQDRQGYSWEVYLKVPGILEEQFQSWPVHVGWEPFLLPEQRTIQEKTEPEETLELDPLKEAISVKEKLKG